MQFLTSWKKVLKALKQSQTNIKQVLDQIFQKKPGHLKALKFFLGPKFGTRKYWALTYEQNIFLRTKSSALVTDLETVRVQDKINLT